MYLKRIELAGFKSFARKTTLLFSAPVTAVVGPNGSGKSNIAEAFRWVLGEQSLSTIRGKRGEDFIFNGSSEAARLNHASATIFFDNSPDAFGRGADPACSGRRPFPLDFDEVSIARHVYRDGTNEYYLNQSKVRLKDIIELIAAVGLGVSNHYIISQGEADRMLAVNKAERMKMIEDALGLAIFEYKRHDAERKLEKTEENLKQVESLRREISPHLKYLKKQVEQIEKVELMKLELKGLYHVYFAHEERYLQTMQEQLEKEKIAHQVELGQIEKEREELEALMAPEAGSREQLHAQRREAESTLDQVRRTKDELSRTLGRLEGMIDAATAQGDHNPAQVNAASRCPVCGQQVAPQAFTERLEVTRLAKEKRLHELQSQQREAERLFAEALSQEKTLLDRVETARRALESLQEKTRQADQRLFSVRARKQELLSALSLATMQAEKLAIEKADFKRECGEAAALLGRDALHYAQAGELGSLASREEQDTRRRQLERVKIRIEEVGGGQTDVLKEYQELTERDEFLAREVADLMQGAESLRKLMLDLSEQLKVQFKEGLQKINVQFNAYFGILFGGGSASLEVVTLRQSQGLGEDGLPIESDEEKPEEGIEINIALPRKKIRGLQMLSGGERTLTSLALLFAVSQVNPPPFLVLDETDAALDESNSKKYGEMLTELALRSQLIIITHNRETMSHAGILYGITLGKDSISRVLSIKFEEAEAIAAR